jgi:hypothetical protein
MNHEPPMAQSPVDRRVMLLPKKKQAVFHHPLGFELYDGLAMDMHAMTYADQCRQDERDRLRELVADDGYAMTFQSMGQYRSALLAALRHNAGHQREP